MNSTQLKALTEGPSHEQFAALQRWRTEHRLPRFVAWADGDQELPIDLDNVMSVETFLRAIKQRSECVIVEMYPPPEDLAATGSEGTFVHELVVPFVIPLTTQTARRVAGPPPVARRHQPLTLGSDWLYLKVYTGTSNADYLLAELISPFVRLHLGKGAITKWFFIRYGDPHWHLRLRFSGIPERLSNEVLREAAQLFTTAINDQKGWKFQVDTYEREIERYGGAAAMVLSEELFWRDSEAALDLLKLVPGDAGVETRWQLCLKAWDCLMSDCGLSIVDRLTLVKQMRKGLSTEFDTGKAVDRALGEQFRKHRQFLEALLWGDRVADPTLSAALDVLRTRSEKLRPVIGGLQQLEAAGQLIVPWIGITSSYLHMQANRLLRSAHRTQEFVLYDFLGRLYESQLARSRQHTHAASPTTTG